MAINLSEQQHRSLDSFLDQLLDGHASGELTQGEARSALAHVLTATAIGNEGELLRWLEKPEVLQRWKADAIAHRRSSLGAEADSQPGV